MRFEVLMAINMKFTVFWDEGICCLYPEDGGSMFF
jgi:hypothetical protein